MQAAEKAQVLFGIRDAALTTDGCLMDAKENIQVCLFTVMQFVP